MQAAKPPHSLLPKALQEQRVMRGVPLRMQTMLVATVVFLIFGSIIMLVSAWMVNRTKDQLVQVAMEEVRTTAEMSRDRIEEFIRDYEAESGRKINSLAEVANSPEVRAEIKLMSRDGSTLISAIVDDKGATVLQSFGDKEVERICPPVAGEGAGFMLPENETGLTWKLQFLQPPPEVVIDRLPVNTETKTVGYVEFGMVPQQALDRLNPISSHITRSLVWMVALVLVCMLLAIYFIHVANMRHLELERRHNQSTHLASIGTMASGLAHEIRNPLHAMNLHLDAAREELEDPRPETPQLASKTIENVQRQIVSLSSILTNFMNFALPKKLELEPVRLAAVVGEVANLMAPDFKERDITFQRDVPENGWIYADPTAVRQVLTNVLLNAAQALEKSERREITLTGRREGQRFVITVDDTGPGLPQGKDDDIFDVFVSHKKGGTGFGLPIARRIMEEHQGSITGETRKEGGARFTMNFQATEEPREYQAISAQSTIG